MARRLKDIIIHLDYEDEYKDGKVEVNIIASEPEELVRCKDCKHWNVTSDGFGECNVMDKQFLGDEYCSYGERKEENRCGLILHRFMDLATLTSGERLKTSQKI